MIIPYAQNVLLFLILVCSLGGLAAWATGRAIALTWRQRWQMLYYALLLSAVVRFFHFSLFDGSLLALDYWLVDALVMIVISEAGFRLTRYRQMRQQYRFLRE
jgi:hypothetical protein